MFVTTRNHQGVDAEARSSGSRDVHWKASKRTLSTTSRRAAAELVADLGVPAAGGEADTPASSGLFLIQGGTLVGAVRPVHVPGEDHGNAGTAAWPTATPVANGVHRALAAAPDPLERAVRMAEPVLHVDHEQAYRSLFIGGLLLRCVDLT